MAIGQKPKKETPAHGQFIAGAGKMDNKANRVQTAIRVPPEILARIDVAASRMGLTRSSFIVTATVEKLEKIGE